MVDRLKTRALMIALVRLAAAIYYGIRAGADDECQRKGSHLVDADRSWLCVTADGRVIE